MKKQLQARFDSINAAFTSKTGKASVALTGIVATGMASAVTSVDYAAIVATATAEVTGAIAAGLAFFGLIRGAKAGMAFIKSMLSGR